MAEKLSLSDLATWRGRPLLSSDGIEIGEVREIIYNYLTDEPVWLGVGERMITLLIPASKTITEGGYIRSAFTRERIENQPPSDFGQGFASLGEEHRLYEYFGLNFDREPELRVLLKGDDLPGQEQVSSI